MTKPIAQTLPVGSTIGILGGGQLARMLAMAAAELGMKVHIYCPEPDSPAFEVSQHHTIANYDDKSTLEAFAKEVDIVTYEFENVPAATAAHIVKYCKLAPGERPLRISQDRLLEKQFLQQLHIDISPFEPVDTLDDLHAAIERIGTPCVLKTTRFGYDGKGQRMINSSKEAKNTFAEFNGVKLVLEAFVPFEKEISVIIARDANGETATFDPAENVHKNHILHTSTVPAKISAKANSTAISVAEKIAHALDYVGILAIEFFVVRSGDKQHLLVNEIAPRVHNSGHWTQDVCPTDQFIQHIRAICGWTLGDTTRLSDVVMTNIIGHHIETFARDLKPNQYPHIYGKTEARPGRKMGHINSIVPTPC